MSIPNSITVDGSVYIRPTEPSPVRIVVLQRGWVMVGRWDRTGDDVTLTDASCIRVWGTTKGLGELVSGPSPATKLDPAGTSRFHVLTVVQALDADEAGWAGSL